MTVHVLWLILVLLDDMKLFVTTYCKQAVGVVYRFQCDLCDASYVGYTLRHLHQRVDEHKNKTSSIGEHYRDKHCIVPKDLDKQFHVIKKCKNKPQNAHRHSTSFC